MILPNNGRIVVVDDDPAEAIPLIRSLSSKGFSVKYFQGNDNKEFPAKPFDDIRILFMDIELGIGNSDRNKVVTLIKLLGKIIDLKQKNKYLIVFWAKDEHLIPNILVELEKYSCTFHCVRIDKSKCRANDFDIDEITKEIEQKMSVVDPFDFFLHWENMVHKSTNEIICEFMTLYKNKAQWKDEMLSIFHKLAKANAGNNLNMTNSNDVNNNAMMAFCGTFRDTLESNIFLYGFDGLSYNTTLLDVDKKAVATINSKLLLTKTGASPQPGNVYLKKDKRALDMLCGDLVENQSKKNELFLKSKLVTCEVSPNCDYAQGKWKVCRLLFGLLIASTDEKLIKPRADYIIRSPHILFGNKASMIVFDIRQLKTIDINKLISKPIFRLRTDLIIDIQHKIAHHASRPGLVSLE